MPPSLPPEEQVIFFWTCYHLCLFDFNLFLSYKNCYENIGQGNNTVHFLTECSLVIDPITLTGSVQYR